MMMMQCEDVSWCDEDDDDGQLIIVHVPIPKQIDTNQITHTHTLQRQFILQICQLANLDLFCVCD
jgi:hypothetical protein